MINLGQIADPGATATGRAAVYQDTQGALRQRTPAGAYQLARKVSVPASDNVAGVPGDFAANSTHLYIYTGDGSTHAWLKIAGANEFG